MLEVGKEYKRFSDGLICKVISINPDKEPRSLTAADVVFNTTGEISTYNLGGNYLYGPYPAPDDLINLDGSLLNQDLPDFIPQVKEPTYEEVKCEAAVLEEPRQVDLQATSSATNATSTTPYLDSAKVLSEVLPLLNRLSKLELKASLAYINSYYSRP